MHLLLVFLAVIVPSALAHICCMPDQFSIHSADDHNVIVDYKNRKAVFEEIDGHVSIYLLADNTFYFFSNTGCYSFKLRGFTFYKQCIPDDAILVSSTTKMEEVGYQVYKYNVTEHAQVEMTIDSKCHPLKSVAFLENVKQPILTQWEAFSYDFTDSVFDRNYTSCEAVGI